MHESLLNQHEQPEPQPQQQETRKAPEIRQEFLQMSNQELIQYIREQFPEITVDVWNQLHILDQPAIELQLRQQAGEVTGGANQDEIAQTHLSYELEMVRLTLAYQEQLQSFLFGESQQPIDFGKFSLEPKDALRRMVFMILFSDVGKAGSQVLHHGESSPILQIYTHVIMDAARHGSWLRGKPPEDLPVELTTSIEYVYSQPVLDQQVFVGGNFSLAPISIAMYCAEEVFVRDFPDHQDQRHLFQLSPEAWDTLAAMGMNPDHTLMKDFWTYAHLYCGEMFAQTEAVHEEDRDVALLALLHHYSQGARPQGASELQLNDPRAMRLIAFTELLDKADANVHRSHQTTTDTLATLTENMVMPGITRQNRGNEEAMEVVAYRDTLQFFKDTQLFDTLLRTHQH